LVLIDLGGENEIMVDRARLAVTKWIPLSSVGAAISFVVGFMFNLPPAQVIISAAMTATLVFSGFAMQSYGRAADDKEHTKVQSQEP
jgi:tetrahydromethanopterin S-methyltransferase subunit E